MQEYGTWQGKCSISFLRKSAKLILLQAEWPKLNGSGHSEPNRVNVNAGKKHTRTLSILPGSRYDMILAAWLAGNHVNRSWQFGGQPWWRFACIFTDRRCIWGRSQIFWKWKKTKQKWSNSKEHNHRLGLQWIPGYPRFRSGGAITQV